MPPVRDFALDSTTWDAKIENGDLAVVEDQEAVRQGIAVRLKMMLGEYYLDLGVGVPWIQRILGKGADHATDAEIKEILRACIASTPDVTQVQNVDFEKGADRRYTISYAVLTVYSTTTLTGQVTVP